MRVPEKINFLPVGTCIPLVLENRDLASNRQHQGKPFVIELIYFCGVLVQDHQRAHTWTCSPCTLEFWDRQSRSGVIENLRFANIRKIGCILNIPVLVYHSPIQDADFWNATSYVVGNYSKHIGVSLGDRQGQKNPCLI